MLRLHNRRRMVQFMMGSWKIRFALNQPYLWSTFGEEFSWKCAHFQIVHVRRMQNAIKMVAARCEWRACCEMSFRWCRAKHRIEKIFQSQFLHRIAGRRGIHSFSIHRRCIFKQKSLPRRKITHIRNFNVLIGVAKWHLHTIAKMKMIEKILSHEICCRIIE